MPKTVKKRKINKVPENFVNQAIEIKPAVIKKLENDKVEDIKIPDHIPVELIKKAEKIKSPKKRRRYLKRLVKNFLTGAAVTAGVLATAAVIYKVSEKGIQRKIDTHVKASVDTAFARTELNLPGVSGAVQNELESAIIRLQPTQDSLIRNAVKSGTEQGMQELKRNQENINAVVSGAVDTAVNDVKKGAVGTPLGMFVGKPSSPNPGPPPPQPKPKRTPTIPGNLHTVVRQRVQLENQLEADNPDTVTTRSQRKKNLSTQQQQLAEQKLQKLEQQFKNNAATKLQRNFRRAKNKRDQEHQKNLEEWEKSPGWGIGSWRLKGPAPSKGSIYGIQNVEFGKSRRVRLTLKTLKNDLKKLK